MLDREKITIARIEYGPTAGSTKVILSNGMELDCIRSVNPKEISASIGVCEVELCVYLKGADNADA